MITEPMDGTGGRPLATSTAAAASSATPAAAAAAAAAATPCEGMSTAGSEGGGATMRQLRMAVSLAVLGAAAAHECIIRTGGRILYIV